MAFFNWTKKCLSHFSLHVQALALLLSFAHDELLAVMVSNVVRKLRHSLMSNKQPVEQEPQKRASKNLPGTKPKSNKQLACNAEQEL